MIGEIYYNLNILEKIIEKKKNNLAKYVQKKNPNPNKAVVLNINDEIENLTKVFNSFEKITDTHDFNKKLHENIKGIFKNDTESSGVHIDLVRSTGKGGFGYLSMMYVEGI